MTALSVMALQSADYYLVPTTATPMSIEALNAFLGFLDTSARELGTQARLVGILLTQVNPYLRLSVDTIRDVRAAYKKEVFSTVIRQSVRLAEAPASGQSIFEYAADSIGAENYNQLRKEFLHRIGT
jgi:chromosome partitioning protein